MNRNNKNRGSGGRSKLYITKYNNACKLVLAGNSPKEVVTNIGINYEKFRNNFKTDYGYFPQIRPGEFLYSDIFENINTEEKAYWLGLLYADGYVNSSRHVVELCLKDRDHIVKFQKFLNYFGKIGQRVIKERFYYRTSIKNVCLTTSLENLGCMQCKSLILQFPTVDIVKKKYIRHFMRGYFDGDGCLVCTEKTKSMSVAGTKDFISDMISTFSLKQYKWIRYGKAYAWQTGDRKHIMYFSDILYNNASVYLDRKYKKYLKYKNYFAVLNSNI